ncbi:hypothetical protein EDC04DRAFT_2965098 [Pisolithus marmoratus]|nr:hypothetical protein EDC04DRAFT_2965098 [Pisolithus marmoratus]
MAPPPKDSAPAESHPGSAGGKVSRTPSTRNSVDNAKVNMVYWRSIIQLNVAQSVLAIPDIVSRAHAVSHSFSSRSSSSQSSSGHVSQAPRPNIRSGSLSPTHRRPSQTQDATGTSGSSGSSSYQQNPPFSLPVKSPEQIIRSSTKIMGDGDNRKSCETADMIDWADPRAEVMKRLWSDPIIKRLMEVERTRSEELRISADVLHSRIKTVDVSEHRFSDLQDCAQTIQSRAVTESGCTPSPLRLFVNAALLIERLLNLADVMQTSVFRGRRERSEDGIEDELDKFLIGLIQSAYNTKKVAREIALTAVLSTLDAVYERHV